MTTFRLTICIEGAELVHDDDETNVLALGLLIREVGEKVIASRDSGKVLDGNGNSVGRFDLNTDP